MIHLHFLIPLYEKGSPICCVSTDEQARLGYSLGHQGNGAYKIFRTKEFEVVNIFREDHSAKNFERPEYKKLFKFCKTHKKEIDFVLITKVGL